MALFLDFLPIVPPNQTPPKFREQTVVAIPSFKVQGTPHAYFLRPGSTDTLEKISAGFKCSIGAFETFIILLDLLGRNSDVRYL
jgi:hypothetical protein